MRELFCFLICLSIVGCSMPDMLLPEEQRTIVGTLSNDKGLPLSNQDVSIISYISGSCTFIQSTKTDDDGFFESTFTQAIPEYYVLNVNGTFVGDECHESLASTLDRRGDYAGSFFVSNEEFDNGIFRLNSQDAVLKLKSDILISRSDSIQSHIEYEYTGNIQIGHSPEDLFIKCTNTGVVITLSQGHKLKLKYKGTNNVFYEKDVDINSDHIEIKL